MGAQYGLLQKMLVALSLFVTGKGYDWQRCCRSRHLLLDLVQLLPHCKKDAKLDTKSDRGVINEIADIKVS